MWKIAKQIIGFFVIVATIIFVLMIAKCIGFFSSLESIDSDSVIQTEEIE